MNFSKKPIPLNQTTIIHQDWLYKESHHTPEWQNCYTVLTDTHIFTYKSQDLKSEQTEAIPLNEIKDTQTSQHDSKKLHTFKLNLTNGKYFDFQAESSEIKDKWISLLTTQVISEKKRTSKKTPIKSSDDVSLPSKNIETFNDSSGCENSPRSYQQPPNPNIEDQQPHQKKENIIEEKEQNDESIVSQKQNNPNLYDRMTDPFFSEVKPDFVPKNYQTLEQKMIESKYGVIIKQKYKLSESLQMCQDNYHWNIYRKDHNDKKTGSTELKYSTKASFYEKCLTGGCRPMKMLCYNRQDKYYREA